MVCAGSMTVCYEAWMGMEMLLALLGSIWANTYTIRNTPLLVVISSSIVVVINAVFLFCCQQLLP